jgi:hypothetical protein
VKALQTQGEVIEDDKTKASENESKEGEEFDCEIDPEEEKYNEDLRTAALNTLDGMAGEHEGVGPARTLRMDPGAGDIKDEYNLAEDTTELKESLFAKDDEDDVEHEDGFLKVYKAREGDKVEAEKKLTADQVKFKAEGDDATEEPEESSTGPMIAEIGSKTFDQGIASKKKKSLVAK